MKNTIGNNVSLTVWGESHGKSIGAVLDGICAGIEISEEFISDILTLRRPFSKNSTARCEKDIFSIESGVFEGKTTGSPIMIRIENEDTRSKDYSAIVNTPRPSHADFVAREKYHGFEDYRGGGHFSGRVTAAICAAGSIVLKALEDKGIYIGSHIKQIGNAFDGDFENYKEDILALRKKQFAVLNLDAESKMNEEIDKARNEKDSIGGMLETAIIGLPAGIGEPMFDSLESTISHAVFSVPAIKGIEFGLGFGFANKRGSEANDAFRIENGRVYTETNNSGGINGGISNAMPIIFRTAIRPTPSISAPQKTVNLKTLENTEIEIGGRHDPCIVHRARIVVDCITAIAVADALSSKYGTDWLGAK